ncbi:MAG: xanthine dehydrogenase accessory protein XdhC, partial [Pseudomonadota bacterium]
MTFDAARLRRALAAHGPVARVVIAEARGSVPRAAGTEMLVWADGFDGTIGGGALEWRALALARDTLASGAPRVERIPLGPALGQCCGGAVTLVIERLDKVPDLPWIRRVEGSRDAPDLPAETFHDGWLRDDAAQATRPVWIWGAGHVGAALAHILAPIPDFSIIWADDAATRFPPVPDGVEKLVAADMPRALAHAPTDAHHIILTYSHDIDLALCHAALQRGFATCGVIGSATKWARFRSRLRALGHGHAEID